MLDPRKMGETITIPTEEEQEAVTGGNVAPTPPHRIGEGDAFDYRRRDKHCRRPFQPHGPPEGFEVF